MFSFVAVVSLSSFMNAPGVPSSRARRPLLGNSAAAAKSHGHVSPRPRANAGGETEEARKDENFSHIGMK